MAAPSGIPLSQGQPQQGQPRPSMRRKSSAQTLLSSFKSSSSVPTTAPATQLSMQIPPPPSAFPTSSGMREAQRESGTPAERTHGNREWDAQSIKSDSTTPMIPLAANANGNPAVAQGISLESLRDLTMKRMITLTYLRNIHEGRSHWFNTVMMTRADLDREFNNAKMKKRTLSFAILGMSLSGVFDNTNAADFLKSLLNILNEHEQTKDTDYKPKMRFFKSNKMPRRGTNAMNDYAGVVPEAGETSVLFAPHIPFLLDYHQTLLSLFDILSEVYNRLSKYLGPSPFPHTNQYMMGPLGVLTPTPGVSYLFQNQNQTHPQSHPHSHHHNQSLHQGGAYNMPNPNMSGETIAMSLHNPNMSHDGDSGSLWGIANGGSNGSAIHGGGGMMSPPPSWNPVLGEMMMKVDVKLKKIIGVLLKELDQLARNAIKEELSSLDPLLRNQSISDIPE